MLGLGADLLWEIIGRLDAGKTNPNELHALEERPRGLTD